MADNTRLSAGTADGATIATDDDGTAHHQYVKVEFGANNTQTPVTAAAPLPVSIGDGTDAALVTAAGELNTLDKNSAAALTALQLIDDPVATLGTTTYTETTTKGMIVGAVRRDADTTLVDTTNEVGPLQMDANGRLKVEAFSGEALPVTLTSTTVTGTVAVTQSGTWDEVGINDSGNSITVDNGGTFPVQETGTWVQVDDAAFTPATSKIAMIGAEFDDAAPDSVDEGDGGAVRMSANRNLYSTIRDAAGNERGANVNASNQLAIAGPVTVASGGVASGAIASGAVASGAVASGAFASGALAAGSIATGAIADMPVDDAAFTPATTRVMMSGFEADETATDSVDEGDAGAARMTLDRKQIVTLQPHTSGGMLCFNSIDLDETEEDVKTSAGQVYSITAFNRTAAPLYLRFYNATAANTTVGSTAAHVGPFLVPANADSDGAGFVWNNDHGFAFDTAICAAVTTGIAANDTGAPGANDCLVVVGYK